MNSDMRVMRGLGIATIVLSSLGIAGGLVIALFMGIASTSLNDPAVVNALVSELQSSGSSSSAFDGSSPYSSYDFSSMTQDEAMDVAQASIMLMVGLSFGYVVAKVVCLVAGIFALRASKNPAKLGGAFGWSIAAAAVSLFVGGMISLVLFVILSVFANRARKAFASMGGYGGQPPMPGQPYQQPMANGWAPQQYQQNQQLQQPQAPQQPQAQQQPQAPQQPQAQQQPQAPQQPQAQQQPGQQVPPAPQPPTQNGDDANSGDGK